MDFGRAKRSIVGTSSNLLGSNKRIAAGRVCEATLYKESPSDAISLDDFECLAVERLKVMAGVEHALSRGIKGAELTSKFEDLMKSTHLKFTTVENKAKDNVSHWVLRLAYAATADLRRRLLSFESMLFAHRFQQLTRTQVHEFLEDNKLGYKPISDAEKDRYIDELQVMYAINNRFNNNTRGTALSNRDAAAAMKWFKVSFTDVLHLVSTRKVFVRGGFAYVPETEVGVILGSLFRAQLSKQLAVVSRTLPFLKSDERVAPVLGKLQNAYLGPEYGKKRVGNVGQVTPENLDDIAPRSFPMCMRQIHHALKQDHHLKYHARVQFRLFLKGVGLTMEDCLRYFQREFSKKGISPEEFQKKYSYNIRHSYGQEGKRANYTPKSCVAIIQGQSPGAGEHHGCPFKSYDEQNMRRALQRNSTVSAQDVNFIIEKMRSKDFQIACRRHFEVTHKGADSGAVGDHPNAWFEQSMKHWNEKSKESGETGNNASTVKTEQQKTPSAPIPPQPQTATAQ